MAKLEMNGHSADNQTTAPSEALAPGSKLLSGQYEIIRYLSGGGFGITYLARDSLNRTVVIKECFPEAFCSRVQKTVQARTQNYVDDFRSIVKLFIREAHALSRLDHTSVVGVHQVFEDNQTAYMALDLVDGNDLLDIIESGAPKMPPDQVRKLTLDLLDAIGHVHSQDLLHRDISPDNILVDQSGRPVLIDFGAAREEASRKSRVLSSLLVVKDGYSPQEFYVAGSQQFPCSDLYALAATLFHLITGEAPPNSQARIAALASNQPDPYVALAGRFSEYEAEFLAAIDMAMNIVPADRLQSALDWVLMIDQSKRVEVARAEAQRDKSIDLTVMNLVKLAQAQADKTVKQPRPEEESSTQPKNQPEPREPEFLDDLQGFDGFLAETEYDVQNDPASWVEEKPVRETPYVRVKSKAIEREKRLLVEKNSKHRIPTTRRMNRFATVPVVFCAYFFYAQTALKFDEVHAATVEPLRALGVEISDLAENGPS